MLRGTCVSETRSVKRISTLIGGAVIGVAFLAACGGGGGSGTSGGGGSLPAVATPTPTPTPAAGQSFTSSDAVAIPTAAPGATSVPVALLSDASSGASASAALPASANVPTDTTVASTYSSTGDSSLPTLSRGRSVAAVRGARDDGDHRGIAYLRLQFSADVTLPQAPAFTFTVPGTLPTSGVSYWLAFFDPLRAAAGWQRAFEGPATVTAATVNGKTATQLAFASNGQPITFSAGQTYWFAVVAVAATAASPTPVPSTVPTNPPHDTRPAPVVASPANVQFSAVTSSPVPVTFSEQNFTGTFTLHGDCTGVINTSGASPTWTLTPVGQGRCVVVAIGDRGASAVVHVGVVTAFETPHPRPSPTNAPSGSPTNAPTGEPSESPEPEPSHSAEPTEPPEHTPSPRPSTSPSSLPSTEPTHAPTATPTASPTATPTPAGHV